MAKRIAVSSENFFLKSPPLSMIMGPHYKEWDDKKQEVCARMGMPREAPCLVIRSPGEDRSDSDDESPPTADEVAKIRVILGTDAR